MTRSLFAAIMLIATLASAQAPSVSGVTGTVEHGETVTISGANFGARTVKPGSFFENWDDGSNLIGDDITAANSDWVKHLVADAEGKAFRYSDEFPRRPGAIHARGLHLPEDHGGNRRAYLLRYGMNVSPGDKIYYTTHYWHTINEPANDCPQQWKMHYWLLGGPTGGVGDYPSIITSWNISGMFMSVRHFDGDGAASATTHYLGSGSSPPKRQWFQVEVQHQLATASRVNDGVVSTWWGGLRGPSGPTATATWSDDTSFYDSDYIYSEGYVYDIASIRNDIKYTSCTAPGDTLQYADLVTQVGSWARVHLGDAATWAACANREYQPVTSWTATSIGITVNQGGFVAEDGAWVYVVTDDGVWNATGYPVEIAGEGGGSPVWAAPTPGAVSGGVITSLTYEAQAGAESYVAWVIEAGGSVPRTAGRSTGTVIPDIPTSTATGTVYVTAHAANDSLLATSQAAAYGGN